MPNMDPCEICNTQAETLPTAGYDGIHQRCPRCGEFRLSGTGIAIIRRVPPDAKVKLSGWVREQNVLGEAPELTSERIKLISTTPLPGLVDRADRLLSFAIRNQRKLGERFNLQDPAFTAVTYSADTGELNYLAKFLEDSGLIKFVAMGGLCEVTPEGYIRNEKFYASQAASTQGFVAMWFDNSMQDAYVNGFEIGIRAAGYDPLRIDSVEHVGKIDDEIIAQLKRSRFVVADFTGQRGGVYFEAGFALGLNLPVFWACRKDQIGELHFDIRQFNCIDWTNPGDLATRLQKRIEAVIGIGAHRN